MRLQGDTAVCLRWCRPPALVAYLTAFSVSVAAACTVFGTLSENAFVMAVCTHTDVRVHRMAVN